jgi:hypothetical protein
MKKMNVFLVSFAVLFSLLFSSVAFASTAPVVSGNTAKVTFQQNEITDKSALFERALSGISDISKTPFAPATAVVTDVNGNKTKVTGYTTTQHLQTISLADGSTTNSYVTNIFSPNFSDGGSISFSKWDTSYGVQAYSTIYWTTVDDSNGNAYYYLTQVVGGWHVSGGLSLLNQSVTLGQAGITMNPGSKNVNLTQYYYPTSFSFSYNAPSSWASLAVYPPADGIVGMVSQTTIMHGGSSKWTLTLCNNNQYQM